MTTKPELIDDATRHFTAARLMHRRGHELLAEFVEEIATGHVPDDTGHCAGCDEQYRVPWPCGAWIQSNSRVLRWLLQEIESNKEGTHGA